MKIFSPYKWTWLQRRPAMSLLCPILTPGWWTPHQPESSWTRGIGQSSSTSCHWPPSPSPSPTQPEGAVVWSSVHNGPPIMLCDHQRTITSGSVIHLLQHGVVVGNLQASEGEAMLVCACCDRPYGNHGYVGLATHQFDDVDGLLRALVAKDYHCGPINTDLLISRTT